jgi:sigma-54 dependent transcriptional regulator, acetoin dehydrogenase operon transcriptional activator AcoR
MSRERTLTALLSSFATGERAETAVLLPGGRADRPGPAPLPAVFVGDALAVGRGTADAQPSSGELLLEDPLVSGRHARITRVGSGYQVEDLGSKNGTFLEENRLEGAPVPLGEGARLFIGNHLFVFRRISTLDSEALDEERRKPLGPVATTSPALARICHKLRRLASSGGELFLAGETGVGKEVYARAAHAASGRGGGFVAINCAALPRELVESELFGYRAGAHSTAQSAKPGLIEEAEGGTLFLDEIGEMGMEAQAKMLRFLQDKEITPLGSTRPRRVDVRVIAATNRAVAAGADSGVRDDLLARLGASPLRLPPLRDRIEDLGALIAHFGRGAAPPFELAAFRAMALYRWPLNVRELEKMLAAAWALAEGRRPIAPRDLAEALTGPATTAAPEPQRRKSPEAAPTVAELEDALAKHAGDVAEVARALGRQRAAVWRWIKQFGLKPEKYRPKSG